MAMPARPKVHPPARRAFARRRGRTPGRAELAATGLAATGLVTVGLVTAGLLAAAPPAAARAGLLPHPMHSRPHPVGSPPAPAVTSISAAFASGDNTYGQLGTGNGTGSSTPIPVDLPAATDLTQVAATPYASYALTATGQVLAWGRGTFGALGNGADADSAVPVPVQIPAGTLITKIAAGTGFGLALTNAGHVYSWGDGSVGQLGDGTTPNAGSATPHLVHVPSGVTVTDIAAGSDFGLALTASGTVLAWGDNSAGQLGDATTTSRTEPVAVATPADRTVAAIGAGSADGYAVTTDGAVLSWGGGAVGELGNGGSAGSTVPVFAALPSGTTVRSVAGGGGFALAVTSDGQLLAWGGGGNGDLGVGSTGNHPTPVPVALPSGTTVAVASAGSGFATAVTSTGTQYAWGANSYGQLGDGTTTTRTTPVPVAVPSGSHVTGAAAGGQHLLTLTPSAPAIAHVSPALAPTTGGTSVTITGSHFTGTTSVRFGTRKAAVTDLTPTAVTVTAPPHAVATADIRVTNAVGTSEPGPADRFSWVSSHSVIGWGYDRFGQLGDGGAATATITPVAANALGATVLPGTVVTGEYAAYGISGTGRVYGWGDNSYGDLGDGTTTPSATPVQVALPAGVVATEVVAGDQDAYAVTSTGRLFAWGYNYEGELGNGTQTDSATPVRVRLPRTARVVQVSASYGHALALTSAGTVFGWGYNADGELGDGTTDNALRPVTVHLPGRAHVTQVVAGYYHSLALTSTGAVLAWGDNSQGALGDGTTVNRLTPVRVQLPAGTTVTQLSAGFLFSSALTSAHTVLDWGYNALGQLGDGTTLNEDAPVEAQLPAGTSVASISTLYYGVEALASTGAVYSWGDNYFGDLGNDTTTSMSTVPTQVVIPAGLVVTRLAGYGDASLAQVEPTRPTVTKVSPAFGPRSGGTRIRLSGTHLGGTTRVRFGATNASFTVRSDRLLIAVSPAHAPGRFAIRVTTPQGTSAASTASHFSYRK